MTNDSTVEDIRKVFDESAGRVRMIGKQIVTRPVPPRSPYELPLMASKHVAQLLEHRPIVDFPSIMVKAGWTMQKVDRMMDLAAS